MDPRFCRRRRRRERTRHLTIRITSDVFRWLKKNEYSATAIFYEAIRELGYKKDDSPKY